MNVDAFSHEPARVDFQHVSIGYHGKNILEDITFTVDHGAQIAVVGPNGAGKTTLFKALVGLLPIWEGNINIHGRPLGQHRDCVAYIPQREEVDFRFPITVQEVVGMGRFGKLSWLQNLNKQDREIVKTCLQQMDILHLADHSIADLSGGQQQRVFLARALAQQPHILLMDEPFTGIDIATQEITLQLFERLKEQKVTILVSTHDLNMASTRFEQTLLLNRKIIAYGTPDQVFTTEHIEEAFGGKILLLDGAVVVDQCCPGDDLHQRAEKIK